MVLGEARVKDQKFRIDAVAIDARIFIGVGVEAIDLETIDRPAGFGAGHVLHSLIRDSAPISRQRKTSRNVKAVDLKSG